MTKNKGKTTSRASKPEVIYTEKAFRKITSWVDICPDEISGYGTVKIVDGALVVTDAFLLEQEVTGSTTEIDSMATANLMCEVQGKEEELGELRLWWHSHVNMGVFWSSTDETAIKTIGGNPYVLSSVFNKRGEVKTRIDSFATPYQMTIDNLPHKVESDDSDSPYKSYIYDIFINKGWSKLSETEEGIREELLECIDEVFRDLEGYKEEYEDKVSTKKYKYTRKTGNVTTSTGIYGQGSFSNYDYSSHSKDSSKKKVAGFIRPSTSSKTIPESQYEAAINRQTKADIASQRSKAINILTSLDAGEKSILGQMMNEKITTQEKDDKLADIKEEREALCDRLVEWALVEDESDDFMVDSGEVSEKISASWSKDRWSLVEEIMKASGVEYRDDDDEDDDDNFDCYLDPDLYEINKQELKK